MSQRSAAEQLARTVPAVPYIGGRWHDRSTAPAFAVVDPVTERRLTAVLEADAAAVDQAVSAARGALDTEWGRMSGAARGRLLYALAQLLEDRAEDFADLESLDVGKPGIEPRIIDLP